MALTPIAEALVKSIDKNLAYYYNMAEGIFSSTWEEEITAFYTTMVEFEMIDSVWEVIMPSLQNKVHYYDQAVDQSITDIVDILGLSYSSGNKEIYRPESGWMDQIDQDLDWTYAEIQNAIWPRIQDVEADIADLESQLTFLTPEMIDAITIVAANIYTIMDLLEGGLSSLIDDVVAVVTPLIQTMIDTKLDPLLEAIGNIEMLIDMIEGGLESLVDDVLDFAMPLIQNEIDVQLEPINDRMTALEEIVGQHEYFFFDWLMDVLAWMMGGMTIDIGDIEDAFNTVGEWFVDEIYAIIHPLERRILKLEDGITDGDGMGEDEVRAIVTEMLEGLEGIAGPQGPAGPPGPMGPRGPAGPPGECEGDAQKTIDEINQELYNKLNQATGITTTRLTGVVDWILATYGVRFAELSGQITPIASFLTDDMRGSLTDLVSAFGTPEALISFILDVEEGQEDAMLALMQVLITMTFERGLI